jgi:glycosyltransferase involved in cell wall biosynthesis
MRTFVSVIIPVYNDPDGLTDTVTSLIKQDYDPGQYEIIIADNGSDDDTLSRAQHFRRQYQGRVKVVVENAIQSSYAARNRGIDAAKGDLLCFIDTDMTVKSGYISELAALFHEHDPDYVGCKVRLFSKEKTASALYNILTGFKVKSMMERIHYAPTCCLTVKKEVFRKIGMFDERLKSGGDHMFGLKAYKAGLKFYYADRIIMYHPARATLKSLLKKAVRIGRYGRGHVSCLYPEHRSGLNRIYLNYRRYFPTRFFFVRKNIKCGYCYRISTLGILSFILLITYYVSLTGYLATKFRYHVTGKM